MYLPYLIFVAEDNLGKDDLAERCRGGLEGGGHCGGHVLVHGAGEDRIVCRKNPAYGRH